MATGTVLVVDAAITRLAEENQRLFDGLMQLENHIGRKLLDGPALRGTTLEHWRTTRERYQALWALHELHRDALAAVRRIRQRRRRPSPADLDDIARLLTGPQAVSVPGRPRRVGIADLVAEMRDLDGQIRAVVTAVEQVWDELSPAVDRCEEILAAAAAVLDPPDTEALQTRLTDLRQVMLADPLSRWTGSGVDRSEVDALLAACEQTRAELEALDDLRRDAAARLERVDAAVAEVDDLERQAAMSHAEAAIKIDAPQRGHPGTRACAASLRAELADARRLHATGSWRALAAALTAVEGRTDAARTVAQAVLDEVRRPLLLRAELRARLDLYRAKAAAGGRSEDLELERAYRAVHDLLWRAPCDLAAAGTALADYQRRVNRTSTAPPERGEQT